MNIHENKDKSYRNKSTCGYCRERGHNQYQCPHVKGDWENFLSRLEIPKDEDGNIIKRGYNYASWHTDGFDPLKMDIANNALASWFRSCKKAYIEQKKRGFNLDHKTKRKGVNRTCGFCGGKDHTRRNCPTMEQFLKDCYKANENWRQASYKELVEIGGLSVGACIQVSYKTGGWNNQQDKTSTGIITKINWDTINVFSGLAMHSKTTYSPVEVTVLVDGQKRRLGNLAEKFHTINKNGEIQSFWRGSPSCNLISVITNSPTPLPPEWVTSYKESFDTLVKKRNYDQLQNGMKTEWRSPNLVAHIDAWK
jgi:hypothetical protein